MRITNEYGIESEWAELPFTIRTQPPERPTLHTSNILKRSIRLYITGHGGAVYIYRSVWQDDKFLRIAKTSGGCFDDYTAAPGVRYEYFVRAVTGDFSFADSNRATGIAHFPETAIAEYDSLHDMTLLLYQVGGIPTKDTTTTKEKTLTNFIGRPSPVLQVGEHKTRSDYLAFYCTHRAYKRLLALQNSGKPLLLRDKRLGSVYGTITGSLSTRQNEVLDGFQVAFNFTQIDHPLEVAIE